MFDFDRSASRQNTSLESVKEDPPVYLENHRESEMSSLEIEFQGLKSVGWYMEVLAKVKWRASKTKGSYECLPKRGKLSSQMNETTRPNTPSLEPTGKGDIYRNFAS